MLIVRYEGNPFAIRMSKVIKTALDLGKECHILIPQNGIGTVNVGREMGWDTSSRAKLLEFPVPRSLPDRLHSKITGADVFGTQQFEDRLSDVLRKYAYDFVMVKDTHCLERVFRARQRSGRAETKVVCDMYENATAQLYDSAIRFGSWSKRLRTVGQALVPRLRQIEKTHLPACDHIFVVVEEAKEFLVRQYGIESERISVVHNVEILDDFDQIDDHDSPMPDTNELLISYVGNVAPHRGVGLLLAALSKLDIKTLPPFHVAVVGASEAQRSELLKVYGDKATQHLLTILGFLPHRTAMQWIKRSDIGVVPHADTEFIRTTVPNKLFQYMAAGAMCIVSDVGPLGRIVRSTNCGATFAPGSAEGLAGELAKALGNHCLIHRLGANGRRSCEQQYCWEIEGQRYADYFSGVIA